MTIEEEFRIKRDSYVPKMLMKDYGFNERTAKKLWDSSKTRTRIETAEDKVCEDDYDVLMQDALVFMEPENAYLHMYFEMIGSNFWLDDII